MAKEGIYIERTSGDIDSSKPELSHDQAKQIICEAVEAVQLSIEIA